MAKESAAGVTLHRGPASLSESQTGLSAANPDTPAGLAPLSPPPYSGKVRGSEDEKAAQMHQTKEDNTI